MSEQTEKIIEKFQTIIREDLAALEEMSGEEAPHQCNCGGHCGGHHHG